MRTTSKIAPRIVPVRYEAPASYALDLEVFPISEFRRRVSEEHLLTPQRVEFHMLLYVTKGTCRHMVDFETHACTSGSLLVLAPGQIQRFDTTTTAWDGWMAIWRPEFVHGRALTAARSDEEPFDVMHDLSVYRRLNRSEQVRMTEWFKHIADDTRLLGNFVALQSLLRHQLQAALIRLHLIQARNASPPTAAPVLLQRFRQFRLAVERELHRLHRVADYASLIGCSQKSLQRATFEVTGESAKTYLSQRIALEAKRNLVHTTEPVAVIAEKLGFDEATNFVKFFRRESGVAPGAFRRRHAASGPRKQ